MKKMKVLVDYSVIKPAKQTHPLIVPPGITKPDIKAKSLQDAENKAKQLYGNDVIVFEKEYNPNWK